MTISQELTEGGICLTLVGSLDNNAAPDFSIGLLSTMDEYDRVTLDFSGLTEMEEAGLRVLLSAQKKANTENVTLIVKSVPDRIMQILAKTGFTDILRLED